MYTQLPDEILNTLHAAGYEAYYVGGCVRDRLLGRPIHDWDITTSALPEETMACFSHCVPTGIRHGTITVLLENTQAEVTTYRTDGTYADGRHPDQVTFVRSLEEDLTRRDFTINAMAMAVDGTVIDLHGGLDDLKRGVIRCVGNPEHRFREDALRMLRAYRFSAQLGFEIEERTRLAAVRCAHLCGTLSIERIRDEVEKTLLSDHPACLREMAELGLLVCCDPDLEKDCGWLASLPKDRDVRWAGLCRLWPELDLVRLRLDKRTALDAMDAGRRSLPEGRLEWKRLISDQGPHRARMTAALYGIVDAVEEILASGECLFLRDLAVNGMDFRHLHGAEVGKMLHDLLEHVLEYPEDNERKKLLRISKNRIDYCF